MRIMLFLVLFGLQMVWMPAVLRGIIRLDPGSGIKMDRKALGVLAAGSAAAAGYIACFRSEEQPVIWTGYLVLAVYLTICTVTDRQICMVYDILQLPAAAAGAFMGLLRPLPPSAGAVLIFFALLQYLVFMRLYGKGDGMAFQICSLYLVSEGGSLEILLLHMASAFGMLGMIQFLRGNINKRGNLKVPVPFIPYIACSVLWFL